LEAFRKLDAEVFGVNPAGIESHQKYSEKHSFTFPLLVDEGGKVTALYGARKTPLGGVARTVYIIDKQGVIRYAQRGLPPDAELLEVLRGLRG
jgi:peroxiredoxin Q/BCP